VNRRRSGSFHAWTTLLIRCCAFPSRRTRIPSPFTAGLQMPTAARSEPGVGKFDSFRGGVSS
jgi:hypothetical protein